MESAGRLESSAEGTSTKAPSRVIIEAIHPSIDGGLFPIKRTVGEEVVDEAEEASSPKGMTC